MRFTNSLKRIEMTKLCKDCKYHKVAHFYSTCTHPELQEPPSPVDGRTSIKFCDFERAWIGKCGPDAKYYEERESIFDLIKNIFKK
jgi:hypothetical protein